MEKLLYVTCNLKPVARFCGLSIGKTFLDEYLRCNPGGEIHCLDPYRGRIRRRDFNGFGLPPRSLPDGSRFPVLFVPCSMVSRLSNMMICQIR
jgi:hypothetical protein